MPTTNIEALNQEVIAFLRQDELDYPAAAAKFGAAALPLLKELINGNDENLAVKAAYLAGYISDGAVKNIITDAASNKFTAVRIAAAFGAQKMKGADATAVLEKSLEDNDPGVVKIAMRSVESLSLAKNFKTQLSKIAKVHVDDVIKTRDSFTRVALAFFGKEDEFNTRRAKVLLDNADDHAWDIIKTTVLMPLAQLEAKRLNEVVRALKRFVAFKDGRPYMCDEPEMNDEDQARFAQAINEADEVKPSVREWILSNWEEVKARERQRAKASRRAAGQAG
ncbi:MAG: HEAT repeat domain-containing protein [Cytophagaceae bacterium]|nr:MAG: HEAT repeat domain-containing protein [Cytophagaceae bacterium]